MMLRSPHIRSGLDPQPRLRSRLRLLWWGLLLPMLIGALVMSNLRQREAVDVPLPLGKGAWDGSIFTLETDLPVPRRMHLTVRQYGRDKQVLLDTTISLPAHTSTKNISLRQLPPGEYLLTAAAAERSLMRFLQRPHPDTLSGHPADQQLFNQ